MFPDETVTLLYTDIEGSTQLLRRLGDGYAELLAEHRRLLHAAFLAHGAREVDIQGDSFFVVFAGAQEAVRAAVAGQRALHAHPWPQGCAVRVRMGLHTGRPARTRSGYVGMDVHRGARLMAAGHGEQVLISEATHDLIGEDLPEGVQWRNLGRHHLRDMAGPERIYQLIIAGLTADFPPLRTIDLRPNNLPASVTPLIGRTKEINTALELLRRADVRLLTLTGTGGTGKTRLSLQVAGSSLGDFEDGVFFVALAPVSDASLIAPAIGQTLEVRETAGQTPLESVKAFLRSRQMLLVLDNYEQVIDAAPLAAELLAACPRLKLLVTSRIALHLRGEHELPVPPLALPDLGHLPPVDVLAEIAAVELFMQRAHAVDLDFALDGTNAPAIAGLCDRLDGLPLAIELAAPRIRTLSPQTLLAQMENRFEVLSGGARDLPERHQTLRNCIAWSYDLLSESEQRLFQRLGVFVGGCTLQAAEAVSGGSGHREIGVLDAITSLRDKNLVRCEEHAPGEMRYTMLETIREYSLERLSASGQVADVQHRHLSYYLGLAEHAHAELGSDQQAASLRRLETEHDNLRAALQWAQGSQPEQALRLAAALSRFWEVHGHFIEGRGRLAEALQKAGASPSAWRAGALCGAGKLAFLQGDFAAAQALLEEGLACGRIAGDKTSIALALLHLGLLASYQDDFPLAGTLLEESLNVQRESRNKSGAAQALLQLAMLASCQLDFRLSNARYEESLILLRQLDDKSSLALALYYYAENFVAFQQDYATAAPLYEESLRIAQTIDQKSTISYVLWAKGNLARERGDYVSADQFYQQSIRLLRELGHKWATIYLIEAYGYLAIARHVQETQPVEAVQQAQEAQPPEPAARAARLLGAAQALRESMSAPLLPPYQSRHQHYLQAVQRSLRNDVFASEWSQGRALTLEQAIAFALEENHLAEVDARVNCA